jgi:hypothetical protein
MSEILDFLFGSRTKARLLRFFLLNSEQEYSVNEVAQKNMLKSSQARKTINGLKKIRFIFERSRGGEKCFILNPKFPLLLELRNLIVKSNITPKTGSLARIKTVGDVKLAMVSGIFLNYPKSKADLILVVNNVNRNRLKTLMANLEAELGREVSYLLMNGDEFKYRLDMLDRFILDFLEGPHDELINKIPRLKQFIAGLKK